MARTARRLETPGHERRAAAARVWLALAVVYVVWGSTYFAIKVAIGTLPPFLMASVRFLLAGAVLFAVARHRGHTRDERLGSPQWRAAFIVGGALLMGGNGGVVWAEQRVPSGVVALIIATIPLWMAVLDRVVLGGRLPRLALAGLALGLAGVVLLIGLPGEGRLDPAGSIVALVAAVSWAAGSLYSLRAPLPSRPLVGTAMEMLAGGALLAVVSSVAGELGRVRVEAVSGASLLALAYLVVFGSLIAFTAYIWLLQNAPTAMVSTYAYVNPVVAVLLGWAFLDEALTPRTLVASAVIVAGVALIVTARTSRESVPPPTDAAPPLEPAERSPGAHRPGRPEGTSEAEAPGRGRSTRE